MKFLLDTNAIIPAEPTSVRDVEKGTAVISRILGLISELQFQVYVHPESIVELRRDKDFSRRTLRETLLAKYVQLPSPPQVTLGITSIIGVPLQGSNDETDAKMLAAVIGNAVDFLVTDDNGVHTRASRLGISVRVLTVSEALATLRGWLPQTVPMPPAVELVHCHQLIADDRIFCSLSEDYPGFHKWLAKVQREHRTAFVINSSGEHAALAIIKEEATNDLGIPSPALKLCTFKVADEFRGYRYGELLLKAVFGLMRAKSLRRAYVTCFQKQKGLMQFLRDFGFILHCEQANGEVVFLKRFDPTPEELAQLNPLEFHVRFGPFAIKSSGVLKFAVPIVPKYHRALFPDLEKQKNMFAGETACGNSILKAYLCRSSIKSIPPGSILLFYQSHGLSKIRAVGIVDDTIRSSSSVEVARFVGKRTVYSLAEIDEMCTAETLAILFRHAKTIPPIHLNDFISNRALNDHPQQITQVKPEADEWIQSLLAL